MDKQMNHPWEPKVASYPLLILDDHATEWAAQIADGDHGRVKVHSEEAASARVHGAVCSAQSTG